jgi:membrane protein insertase Oxa1/YidC/SpoIIIJ
LRVKDVKGFNYYFDQRMGGMMATATADSELKVKVGKMIFYITCAVGLWFFYWFAGIQCPC